MPYLHTHTAVNKEEKGEEQRYACIWHLLTLGRYPTQYTGKSSKSNKLAARFDNKMQDKMTMKMKKTSGCYVKNLEIE